MVKAAELFFEMVEFNQAQLLNTNDVQEPGSDNKTAGGQQTALSSNPPGGWETIGGSRPPAVPPTTSRSPDLPSQPNAGFPYKASQMNPADLEKLLPLPPR